MAETDPHVMQIIALVLTLRHWFRTIAEVYVGANMFLYYHKGRPKRRVAPDVFVVWGASKEPRRSFKLWEERQAPHVVFEITSRKTREDDLGKKRVIYAQIGVPEYYLFDPLGHYLQPPLRGYQLVGEEYALRFAEEFAPPGLKQKQGWRLISKKLNLELWALSTQETKCPYILRFYDSVAKQWLVNPDEAMVERELLQDEVKDAQKRIVQLEAELKKLRGQ